MDAMTTFSRIDTIPPTFGRARIIKNLIVMSLSLMLIFTAYDGLSMLQSTMNKEQNVGTISQAVGYISFCLSSLTLPKYAIKKLGCKVNYLIAITLFLPYIAANFYPSWTIMMPAAVALGIAASLIWAAQTNYFSVCVVLYCSVAEFASKNKTKKHALYTCNATHTEKLPNDSSNCTESGVVSGDTSDFSYAKIHTLDGSNCRSVEVSKRDSKHKTVGMLSRGNACCPTVEVTSENGCKYRRALSGDESTSTSIEVHSEKNPNNRILHALSVDNSNHSTMEVHSEKDYNYVSEDKLSVINSGCNILKAHSAMKPVNFVGENFASTETLIVNNFNYNSACNFITINSEQQKLGVFSVTNPNYINSEDNVKNLNSQCSVPHSFAINVSSNHTAEPLYHAHFGSPSLIKTFKGEITPGICEIRSRYLNKHKLAVSITPEIKENIPKSFDGDKLNSMHRFAANSELDVEDLESLYNCTGKTNILNDDKDIQCDQEIHRKSEVGKEVIGNIENIEFVTACSFGCNGLLVFSAHIWSNLVSYYVLQDNVVHNFTMGSYTCGAAYCNTDPDYLVESAQELNVEMRYLLSGIYVTIGLVAIFLVLFLLDSVPGSEKQPVKFSFNYLMATFNHCKKGIQICIIPLSLYIGMIQGFYAADFTKSYIVCALGISQVGLVTVYYGLACVLSSTLSGYLVKYTGRIPIFLLIQVTNLAVIILLLVWTPDPTFPVIFYLAAGLLGVVVGILLSQVPAFYSILFKKNKEAAFASHYVFNSFGWLLSFAYSNYLCTSIKIYILIAVSSLGILGFLMAERMYRARKNKIGLTLT